ncbi:hypothetical protein EI555_017876 [Monodon monoceros]|uniref:Uncharacterized protein n=1 Tax=Monodon monoceros TaxID=40151 RepID=A0A4U1FM34_MONMO|nr:hypothetical protein EI555_017876 [Monodon monoceros]
MPKVRDGYALSCNHSGNLQRAVGTGLHSLVLSCPQTTETDRAWASPPAPQFPQTHHILHRDVVVQAILYLLVCTMQPFPVSNLQGHGNVIPLDIKKFHMTRESPASPNPCPQRSLYEAVPKGAEALDIGMEDRPLWPLEHSSEVPFVSGRASIVHTHRKILKRALKNVTVSFRGAEENAVWIRIAWGTQYGKPNQYKPAYVVYYSQTPYAFTSSSQLKSNLPLLGQALTIASKHHQTVKMDLRSQYLDAFKANVFKQYNQTFETQLYYTSTRKKP